MIYKGKEVKKKEIEAKKFGVALKSTKEESDSSDDDEEKEMAMFAKRFRRFMRSNKGRRFQREEGFKSEPKDKKAIICYECKKPRQKHKAHVAT